MLEKWMAAEWAELAMVMLSAVVVYAAVVVYTRISGLRSFSKMSAADFAMTVAVGSIFASTISSPNPSLAVGLVALASLFGIQWLLAALRKQSDGFSRAVDNRPILLMAGGKLISENLLRAQVTENDVFGKLREANALNYDSILAVVFETTGDISVLHSNDAHARLEPDFFDGVVGADRLFEHL